MFLPLCGRYHTPDTKTTGLGHPGRFSPPCLAPRAPQITAFGWLRPRWSGRGAITTRRRQRFDRGTWGLGEELHHVKIIKIANTEPEKRRKSLATRLAELFLELFDVLAEIERLRK